MSEIKNKLDSRIVEIADYLLSHADTIDKETARNFAHKFLCSDRTIYLLATKARTLNHERLREAEKEKQKILNETSRESIRKDIMEKDESLIVLTRIARGVARKIKVKDALVDNTGNVVAPAEYEMIIPSDKEIVSAVDKMSVLRGWQIKTQEDFEQTLDKEKPIDKSGFDELERKYKELLG